MKQLEPTLEPKCWCGAPWGVCAFPWWCYGRKFDSRQRPGKRKYPPSPRLAEPLVEVAVADRPTDLVTGNDDSSETEAAE